MKPANADDFCHILVVAPHGGAWIETRDPLRGFGRSLSPLTEGRGLKLTGIRRGEMMGLSPLTEGRGLKLSGASLSPSQL